MSLNQRQMPINKRLWVSFPAKANRVQVLLPRSRQPNWYHLEFTLPSSFGHTKPPKKPANEQRKQPVANSTN